MNTTTNHWTIPPMWWGIIGTIGMSAIIYAIQAFSMRSLSEPIFFVLDRWFFILPLVVGFGIQIGLLAAIRRRERLVAAVPATSGTSSVASVAACCLHNLTWFAPLAGIGGFAAILGVYQNYIFAGSIAISAIGVGVMWYQYQRMIAHTITT